MSVVLTLGLVLLVGLWALATYNRLVRLRQRVKSEWRQIEVRLKQHHDLVGELISAVGPRLSPDTAPSDVMAARNRAISARGPADAGVKEAQLAKSLTRFRALLEQHAE